MTEPTKEQREEFWAEALDRFVEVIMGKVDAIATHCDIVAPCDKSTELTGESLTKHPADIVFQHGRPSGTT